MQTESLPRSSVGSQLDQLRQLTTVVADTGEIEAIRQFAPQDATTNPTLIYKAVQMDRYSGLLDKAAELAEKEGQHGPELVDSVVDYLLVLFGREILQAIPGRVSTEVDARLSFDTEATVAKAKHIMGIYQGMGIEKDRVLIKIASTWEGLSAARELEKEGIHCNLTLLFSLIQAVAAAEFKCTFISPFVGRILDWYKKATGKDYNAEEDPGVESVRQIYHYLKHHNYPTEVMGASFRNIGEIRALAGCDLLTISPALLEELKSCNDPLPQRLSEKQAQAEPVARIPLDEKTFRWHLNADPMATDKLAEGIRSFAADTESLCELIEREILD